MYVSVKKKIVCLSCYESWLNVRTISLLFQIKFVIQITETFLHNPSDLVMYSNHLQHCYALSGPDEILSLVWGPHLGCTNQVVYQTNQDKPSIHHSTCQARML